MRSLRGFSFGSTSRNRSRASRARSSRCDGTTTCTLTVLYPSRETRDAALETGMKDGAAISFDRLAEYLHMVSN